MAGSSIEAMEDMIYMLTKFQMAQEEVESQLKVQYDTVGTEWNDIQYRYLGDTLNEIYTTLNNEYLQISECITKIQVKKRLLEEYLNSR